MAIRVRPWREDEFETAGRLITHAFLDDFDADELDLERTIFEFDRSLAAFDGGVMVATFGGFTFEVSVPGGRLSAVGTTWVSVAPTHRRRGLMRQLMTRHLHDARERGEQLAMLWASEAVLYRRFGYGLSAERMRVEVALRPGPSFGPHAEVAEGAIEHVDLDEAAPLLAPVYDAVRARRPGLHQRSKQWWTVQVLSDLEKHREGYTARRVAVLRTAGKITAYAIYRTKISWSSAGLPDSTVDVIELAGVDSAAEAALWRFLLDLDLAGKLVAGNRPLDDPLPLLLADPRLAQRSLVDALWTRVIDVPAALAGRRYSGGIDVKVGVSDELCPWNDGTWRVSGDEKAASCKATKTAPDLEATPEALGAMILGGASAQRLAEAGLLTEHRRGALARLDRALRSPAAPWSPQSF